MAEIHINGIAPTRGKAKTRLATGTQTKTESFITRHTYQGYNTQNSDTGEYGIVLYDGPEMLEWFSIQFDDLTVSRDAKVFIDSVGTMANQAMTNLENFVFVGVPWASGFPPRDFWIETNHVRLQSSHNTGGGTVIFTYTLKRA